MFPIRHSWIFRSRWVALLWAAGMIWFALDIAAPPADAPNTADGKQAERQKVTDVAGQWVDEEQVRALEDKLRNM
ncbi:hypothetical protein [Sphingomonas jaspsi]|uniref:hypothetical protein n=1 Tax=Sphingomonas jaspsi TaxID=392409 RepID=UPI0004AF28ED|nr:hypothetical protein [Sphingomonas jaspsi]